MTMTRFLAIPALILISSCSAVGPDHATPDLRVADRFVGGDSTSIGQASDVRWWARLGDARLNALVARGLAQNLDMGTAFERIRAAEARLGATGINAQVSGGVEASSRRTGGNGIPTATTDSATLSAAYVFDLFGATRRGREQAVANYRAAGFDLGTMRLAFLSSLIGAYTDLRYFQEAVALTRRNIASRQETLDLVLAQREFGSVDELQVALAQAQLDSAKAQLPPLEAGFNARVFSIATLLAEPAAPLMNELQKGAPQPFPPASSGTGTPANLLRNRPDILAAEQRLAASLAAVGVAEAQLYPSLALSGNVTANSATTWGFGPILSLPILNRGALEANRNVAMSTARQAELDWRKAVLVAVEDVQRAQSNYVRKRREVVALRSVVASTERVRDLTRSSYEAGQSSLLDLLDAERSAANSRLSLAEAVRSTAVAWFTLEIATGHGWAVGAPAPEG